MSFAASGCDDAVRPPAAVPLTPDQQVVANCYELRDSLEAYAARNGGNYPDKRSLSSTLSLGLRLNPYTGVNEFYAYIARFPGEVGLETYVACDDRVMGYRITGHGRDRKLIELEAIENVPADQRWTHDVMVANALAVAGAAASWAESNGRFPWDLSERGVSGKSLIDLLPQGESLFNPVTGARDLPIDGPPTGPGEIGYTSLGAMDGIAIGFLIDGYGSCWEFFALLNESDEESGVRFQCHHVRRMVEEFAEEAGRYPLDVNTDETGSGKTALDFAFNPYTNPYTDQPEDPVNGIASTRGQTGYSPVIENGVVVGYLITGRGTFDEIARLGPLPAAR